MRPLILEPRHVRGLLRDLESASDELVTAAGRVDEPRDGYPWHGLVERGVASLLRSSVELVESCRGLSDRAEESLRDFEELDGHVASAAGVTR